MAASHVSENTPYEQWLVMIMIIADDEAVWPSG